MRKALIIILSCAVISSLFVIPAFAGAAAPSLTIDISGLTAAMGGSGGGEVEVLDLSWYTPFKERLDNLISGFLWLGYIWHLFKIAPSLLGSVGLFYEPPSPAWTFKVDGADIPKFPKGGGLQRKQ